MRFIARRIHASQFHGLLGWLGPSERNTAGFAKRWITIATMFVCICLIRPSECAFARTIEIEAVADTWSNSEDPNRIWGTWKTLTIGQSASVPGTGSQIVYLRFDADRQLLDHVRAASVEAELILYQAHNLVNVKRVEGFRIADPWDELTLTYNTAPLYDTRTSLFTSSLITGYNTFRGPNLDALAEAWLNGVRTDHGVAIVATSTVHAGGGNSDAFVSKDSSHPAHPKLRLTFSIVGDMDNNGVVDAFDVDEFEMALSFRSEYLQRYPGVDPDLIGDLDGNGIMDAFDVDDFEAMLAGGGEYVPEPASALALALGCLTIGVRRRC